VTLNAFASDTLTVPSWQGCTPLYQDHCILTMDAHKTVTATFEHSLPVLAGAWSLKYHGSTPFSIPIDYVSGAPSTEPRNLGTDTDHVIVLSFDQNISTNVVPTSAKLRTYTVQGVLMTIYLANVTNASCETIHLSGVEGNDVLRIRFLVGDIAPLFPIGEFASGTGNGTVNSVDLGIVRSKFGQTVNSSNFRADLDRNDTLNAVDLGIVRSKFGTFTSACSE
jgi:hypothetical protein